MKMLLTLTAILMFVGMVAGGCSTDVPILSNQRAARLEGVELYNRGDFENAAGAFRNAVKQDPRDFRSQYYLGLTYEQLGNFQQAIQAYKSALKIMRETPLGREAIDFRQIVMNTLASTLVKHDQDALEQNLLASQAASLQLPASERAEAYFLIAKISRYRGDADTALQNYFKGSELAENDFWLQKEAGLYMLQMGKKHSAVKPLRRAVAMNTRDEEVITAMQQLDLKTPQQLLRASGPEPVFKAIPLPDIEPRLGEPVRMPEKLPMD